MRNRRNSVSVWLDHKEKQHLQKQAQIAGLKIDPFIRELIKGAELKEHPPEIWAETIRQLAAIGNNINQIAKVANTEKTISNNTIAELLQMQSQIWQRVKNL